MKDMKLLLQYYSVILYQDLIENCRKTSVLTELWQEELVWQDFHSGHLLHHLPAPIPLLWTVAPPISLGELMPPSHRGHSEFNRWRPLPALAPCTAKPSGLAVLS